jgi:hypothetical protein
MKYVRRTWPAFALPSVVVVLMLWLPFGFSLHGLLEEWGVLGLFTNTGPVLFVKSQTMLEAHRLRPLTVFPHAVAYLLDRDSFDSWNWILMATLVLKGGAASYLAAIATRSPRWGVFFGVLVLLYPADTMQLSFRSQHINLSLSLLLLGAAVLVRTQYQEAGWARRVLIALGCASMLAAQMMYEVALMIIGLPLFVLWCREGTAATLRELRRNLWPALGWIASAVLYVLYVVVASASGGDSYQQTITNRNSPFTVLYQALPKLFDVGIARALVGGWFDAWGMAAREFRSYLYLFAFGLISSGCILFFPASEQERSGHSVVFASKFRAVFSQMRMAVVGALLLVLGYVPYLFSASHVLISQRTFLFSTLGAALIVTALVMSLAKFSKMLACASVALLLTTGAASQLYQFHHYVALSEDQRKILRAIVENFDPSTQTGKTLLILDHSGRLSHSWMLRDNLDFALTYLYGKSVESPYICLMPTGDWQKLDSIARTGRCIEDSQAWTFRPAEMIAKMPAPAASDIVKPKSQLLQISIDLNGNVAPDSGLALYRRLLETADTPSARRYRNILKPDRPLAALNLFRSAEGESTYRWDFGKWWSLEQPTQGSGWREAEWSQGYLHHDAAAWKSQEKSSLIFNINPSDQLYEVAGTFDLVRNASIRESMRVLVNGDELPIRWATASNFSASIPKGLLRHGTNVLELNSAVDKDYYGLSARLTSIEVRVSPAQH